MSVTSVDGAVATARANAAAGLSVLEVMEEILRGMVDDFSTFKFIYILNQAFGVPPRCLKLLSACDHLGRNGLLTDTEAADQVGRPGFRSTAEAVELVRPWLLAAGASDGTDGPPDGV